VFCIILGIEESAGILKKISDEIETLNLLHYLSERNKE